MDGGSPAQPVKENVESESKYPQWHNRQALDRQRFLEIETVIRNGLRSLVAGESLEERRALIDTLARIGVLKRAS